MIVILVQGIPKPAEHPSGDFHGDGDHFPENAGNPISCWVKSRHHLNSKGVEHVLEILSGVGGNHESPTASKERSSLLSAHPISQTRLKNQAVFFSG